MAFERLGEKNSTFPAHGPDPFRGTVDDDAKKIRSEQLGKKPETTVAALCGAGKCKGEA